jgi:hypothetical protein
MKAVGAFETPGETYPTTGAATQKICYLSAETSLRIMISLSAVLFPVGKAATLPLH